MYASDQAIINILFFRLKRIEAIRGKIDLRYDVFPPPEQLQNFQSPKVAWPGESDLRAEADFVKLRQTLSKTSALAVL